MQISNARSTSPGQIIFLDPSGRRWRRLRLAGAILLSVAVLGVSFALPRLDQAPQLEPGASPPEITSRQTGLHVPIIGEGPLVRVLRVEGEGERRRIGVDPFTNIRSAVVSPADVRKVGDSSYIIQKFGYPAGTRRTISLTFDDGPDPKWTPELLNLLSKEKVPATFFVTGSMIARHPEIISRESREGHAVANHSMTHVDMTETAPGRARAELTLTDRLIRAVTGKQAGYVRLPYEGDDEESTQASIDGILRAQRWGYLVASHDFDSNDWAYATNSHPIPLPDLNGQNVNVLVHDGGGTNRQKTVEYIGKELIPYAKARGYKFTTMPQVHPELALRTKEISPNLWDETTLYVARSAFDLPHRAVHGLFLFALFFVVVVGLGNCLLALIRRLRRDRTQFPTAKEMDLPVSVVLAAYNEAAVIHRTLRTILAADYPLREVVVVDDGSKDATAEIVRTVAAQDPRVVLIEQPNSGKASALNRGIAAASGEIIVTLDADTVLTPTTITNLVRHFALDADGRLGAVAGVVRVGNRTVNLLTRWQALEYLTQIGVERAAQDQLGAISIVPGACAAWRKEAILQVGGYSSVTLAEDCDLSLFLHRAGWRITQDDEALAFTEAPQDVDSLLAQRTRWTFGTLQSIWRHRAMLFRVRYGFLGWFVLPNYVLSVLAPVVFLPFMVVMTTLAVSEQGWGVLGVYFGLFLMAHLIVAAIGIALSRERPHHLLMMPIYRIVYEPLRAYLLYTSLYLAARGVRMGWNKLKRTGTVTVADLPGPLTGGGKALAEGPR